MKKNEKVMFWAGLLSAMGVMLAIGRVKYGRWIT